MTITAAADGSALGNPGPAGWAWVIDHDHWSAGGWPHGTNNMGELMAVLDLLNATALAGLADEPLHVLCDSQYAINTITKWMPGWKKKGWRKADKQPIKNLDLVQQLDEAVRGRTVTFEWVKGHAGHALNELADDRARAAATAYQRRAQPDAGPGLGDLARAGAPTGEPAETTRASAADESAVAVEARHRHAADTLFDDANWVGAEDDSADLDEATGDRIDDDADHFAELERVSTERAFAADGSASSLVCDQMRRLSRATVAPADLDETVADDVWAITADGLALGAGDARAALRAGRLEGLRLTEVRTAGPGVALALGELAADRREQADRAVMLTWVLRGATPGDATWFLRAWQETPMS